jgi:multicomponent Na+:H+ antiporter subunit A
VYSFGTRAWHDLAAAGVLADLGLALVAAGALGLDGAALVLTLMVLTRPLMFMLEGLDMRRAWPRVGAVVALLGVAGMPPAIGFAARLLVLAAVFRLNAALAGWVLVGLVLELAASARAVMARLGSAENLPDQRTPTPAQRVAIPIVAGVGLVAGVLPGVVLSRLWGLG